MSITDHLDSGFKHLMDWLSISTAFGAFMGWLPEIAAVMPIVWYGIKIYETKTVRKILGKKGKEDGNNN